MNTHTVVVEGVFGVKGCRSMAFRKCVNEHPLLRAEFMKNYFRSDMTTDEWSEANRKFIREKGLRILNEKPLVRTKDDRYVVDVYCTITW